jgi:hypothetical protein
MSNSDILASYDSIFHETGLLKLNKSNLLVEIKEELIEFNPDLGIITSYSVVLSQARNSLAELFIIWGSKEVSHQKREFFSPEKLSYYFY